MIIKNLSVDWPCLKDWVSDDGTPNYLKLSELFGNLDVPVAFCDKQEFNDQKRTIMKMDDFIKKCKQNERDCLLYLKDWHLFQEKKDYKFYNVPKFFKDDWINNYWDYLSKNKEKKDDYRFVYMGMKGSFTPLHKDVFRSFSWSTNICGKKLWFVC